MRSILFTLLALIAFFPLQASDVSGKPLVVHEWGTFTSLQNEYGDSVGGVNNEEEQLPRFVHTLGMDGVVQTLNRPYFKGGTGMREDVTMRLETPVVYFHLPAGVKETRLDLNVKFNGGFLTQYFPIALATPTYMDLHEQINAKTQGALTWKNLLVGSALMPPTTESEIWKAPRKVDSAVVQASRATCTIREYDQIKKETVERPIPQVEQYLFYRGVGRLDAPLRISRTGGKFVVQASSSVLRFGTNNDKFGAVPNKLWLVDIAEDGSMAWRKQDLKVPVIERTENSSREIPMAEFGSTFEKQEYQSGNREKLKLELKEALMQDGLFADEADAMLNTWEASYFKTSGLRAFFMVPQEWTDRVLPMDIKTTLPLAEVKRAMIARVELITPEQRELTGKIVAAGSGMYEPEVKKLYTKLGRFRNAILLDVRNKLRSMDDF